MKDTTTIRPAVHELLTVLEMVELEKLLKSPDDRTEAKVLRKKRRGRKP